MRAQSEEVEADPALGHNTIFGFKLPGQYVGYFEEPNEYRQEKAQAFFDRMKRTRQRLRQRRLVSTWRVDPAQPQFTRRQLAVAAKVRDTLEALLEMFVGKHAPLLAQDGALEIVDVVVTRDMRTATVIWCSTDDLPSKSASSSSSPSSSSSSSSTSVQRRLVDQFLSRHLKQLRFELTQALQPHKYSPELHFVHLDDHRRQQEPEQETHEAVAALTAQMTQLADAADAGTVAAADEAVSAAGLRYDEPLRRPPPELVDPQTPSPRERRRLERLAQKFGPQVIETKQKEREDHVAKLARQMAKALVSG